MCCFLKYHMELFSSRSSTKIFLWNLACIASVLQFSIMFITNYLRNSLINSCKHDFRNSLIFIGFPRTFSENPSYSFRNSPAGFSENLSKWFSKFSPRIYQKSSPTIPTDFSQKQNSIPGFLKIFFSGTISLEIFSDIFDRN